MASEMKPAAVTKIKLPHHLEAWKKSSAFQTLTGFISAINTAVQGKSTTDEYPKSENVLRVVSLLDALDAIIAEVPPEALAAGRYGNLAFRKWHARMCTESRVLLREFLSHTPGAGVYEDELHSYLVVSFGNETRIDYGSGHELAFVAFLCCLALIKVFVEDDLPALCLHVFAHYLGVVRHVQRTYTLEPAGSHGVWGLDDHQFLPYYWGSSQLCVSESVSESVRTASIPDQKVAERMAQSNLFFACIEFIFQTKRGPFHEHSRYLFDMSAVPDWTKVNKGLLRMFQAEVLHKFPVIQHFLFGSLLALEVPEDQQHEAVSHDGDVAASHTHAQQSAKPNGPTSTWGGPVPQRVSGSRGPVPFGADAAFGIHPAAAMSPGAFTGATAAPVHTSAPGVRVAESGSLRSRQQNAQDK